MVGYKFIAVGHKMPGVVQRETMKTNSRLEEAFERWMEEIERHIKFFPEDYKDAYRVLKDMGIKPSVEEVHSLLIKHQDEPGIKRAGVFLSAAYNLSDEKVIVYDLDLPLYGVGYKLDKNKVLINRGKVGIRFAWDSSGISINYGKCGNNFAWDSSGISINYGKCGIWFGGDSSGILVNCGYAGDGMGRYAKGTIIALKNPKSFEYTADAELLLKEEDCKKLPELRDYFDELNHRVENNDYEWLKTIAPRMKDDIESMVKWRFFHKKLFHKIISSILYEK